MEQQQQNNINQAKFPEGTLAFVAQTDSNQVAMDYISKLREQNIPCEIGDRNDLTASFGFGIYVPQQFYDKAIAIIDSIHFLKHCKDLFYEDTSHTPQQQQIAKS